MIDEIDRQLLLELKDDAHQHSSVLAQKLHVSSATVRRRIHKLISSGVIKIVARLDSKSSGLNLAAVIGFDVEHNKVKNIIQTLLNRRRISWASATTGRYRIIAFARFADMEDLQKYITEGLADIEGINNIETHILLNMRGATNLLMRKSIPT